jgi:vacuolar-type H+-ATPase subunit H
MTCGFATRLTPPDDGYPPKVDEEVRVGDGADEKGFLDKAKETAEGLVEKAKPAVDSARQKAEPALEKAKPAIDKAGDVAGDLADKAKPALDKAKPALDKAGKAAGELLDKAKGLLKKDESDGGAAEEGTDGGPSGG